MIVLDASAAVNLLVDAPVGGEIAARLAGVRSINVPAHFDFEVFATFRNLTLRNVLSAHEATGALAELEELTIHRWPAPPFLSRAFALRGSIAAGDAFYVALAEVLGAPLLTCDARLAGGNTHRAVIEVVEPVN